MPIKIIEYDIKSLMLLMKLIIIPKNPNVINPNRNSKSL